MTWTRAIAIVGGLAVVAAPGCEDVTPPALQLSVTAVSPASGPLAGGTSITITGTNFTNVTSVTIGGIELISPTVVSATQITGTTPAVTNFGAADVIVTSSSHGRGTCPGCFSYHLSFQARPLVAGTAHTCALTSSGMAYCWGMNLVGQLGSGTTTSSTTPVAVTGDLRFIALAAGGRATNGQATDLRAHTCGLTTSGTVYCWGNNWRGQLGDGSTTNSSIPVAVYGGLTFRALASGAFHTCALSAYGHAYCWGTNYDGQLGDSSTDESSIPVAVVGGIRFRTLVTGRSHTCGLTGAGKAHCWGGNSDGQLGDGSTTDNSAPVAVAGGLTFTTLAANPVSNATCGLATTGAVYCWGRVFMNGSLVISSIPVALSGDWRFSALAVGSYHTCGLTSFGAAYCWGVNFWGELGDGSTNESLTPVAVTGGWNFTALAAGDGIITTQMSSQQSAHTCGLTTSGAVYCWGGNSWGQLGNGSTTDSSIPVAVAPF